MKLRIDWARVGAVALAALVTFASSGCIVVVGNKGARHRDHDYEQFADRSRADSRPFIGVTSSGVTDSLAAQLDVNRRDATLITSVVPDRPAARAGLEQWDVIIGIEGAAHAGPRDFRRSILETAPGDALALDVLRRGEVRTIEVTPEPRNARRQGWYSD